MTSALTTRAQQVYDDVLRRNPAETEFHQAVREVLGSLAPVLARHPEYVERKTIERICEPERQIIGIVADTRDRGLNNDPPPTMYVPQAQLPDAVTARNMRTTPLAWVVRTRTAPLALRTAIEEQLRQATGLPVSNVESMEDIMQRSTSRQRFNMWLMSVFGASALLLAAIGIYGLMAYTVEQRTPEIGIRLALGAEGSRVKNMVVMQGMRLALVGVVVGVGASFGLTRFLASFLFGVAKWDPLVFVSVPLLLSTVALLAVWWPARRASRVDPVNALRAE